MGKFNLRNTDVKTMNVCYLVEGRDGEDSHMHHSQLQLPNKTLSLYKQANITVFRLPMAEWLVCSAIISIGEI